MDIYELVLTDSDDGIKYVSLVDDPAVEVGWQCYGKEKKPVQFSVTEERVITGVIMIPEKLIYRYDEDSGYEYQVYYSKETIRDMCELMLKNNTYKYVDLNHGNQTVGNKATLLEVFLKDTKKGINPTGFEDLPDGTMLCSYHIHDEELWSQCKNGEFNGFSLEGVFLPKLVQDKGIITMNNMLEKFKETLKRILSTFGRIETKEGVIAYNEEELSKGVEVYDPETGEPTADGEYHTETGVIVITDGKVADIIEEKEEEPAQEETVMEEPVEEEPVVEEPDTVGDIEGIKSEIETIKGEIAEIKSLIEGLKDTEKEPIEEEFEKNRKKFSSIDGSKLVETLKNIKKTTNNKY